MFGFRRRKPLTLTPFTEARPRTFGELLCDGVTAHHLASLAELLDLHDQLQQAHPTCRILTSLDDLGQASYTSGHATDVCRLDDVEGHDLAGLDESLFEDGEHCGYLSTPAEFPIRLANLRKQAQAVAFSDLAGSLYWVTEGDANDLLTINRNPDATLRIASEKDVILQYVPVEIAADAIAAFPNGYFHGDLRPMQNHALALHLEKHHRLTLIGIGSRFLGFRSAEPLSENAALALAADLASIYIETPPEAQDDLSRLLTGRDFLLLRYTES